MSSSNRDNRNSSNNGSIGFAGMLTVLFIGLKLCEVINWSWLWVLSPLWLSFAVYVLIFVAVIMVAVVMVATGAAAQDATKKTPSSKLSEISRRNNANPTEES